MAEPDPLSTLRTVLSGQAYLECPRWHEGRIWVSDFYTHQVISALEDGTDVRVEAEVPGQPSGMGWLPDGRLLVVSMHDQAVLRREVDGRLVSHADVSHLITGLANDMIVDAQGRAYLASFGFELSTGPMRPTSVVIVYPDGSSARVADDIWFPNGMMITDDGHLLVNETFGNRTSAFAISADGTLGPRRDWATFADLPAVTTVPEIYGHLVVAPDGGGLDANGDAWIADALNGRVLHVRAGGTVLSELAFGTGVFACLLGGADGRTLFVCTAPDPDPAARSAARESSLLAVTVPVGHGGTP